MTTKTLLARLDRLRPTEIRPMVVRREEDETDEDLACRARAVGHPVAVMPLPCATAEEWLLLCAPKAGNG